MPGGNGRPQKGMNRKNHHDNLGYSGQQRYGGGSSSGGKPKYTPPKQQRSILEDLMLGRQFSNKPRRKK